MFMVIGTLFTSYLMEMALLQLQSKQGYYDNHIYIGIVAIIPLLLSFLFHAFHWWKKEKVEN